MVTPPYKKSERARFLNRDVSGALPAIQYYRTSPSKPWVQFGNPELVPSLNGIQFTVSEDHPWNANPRPPGDLGGPFYTRKIECEEMGVYNLPPMYASIYRFDNLWAYPRPPHGLYWPSTTAAINTWLQTGDGKVYGQNSSSDDRLIALGTTAIERCSPTRDVSSLVTAITELAREGLPRVPGLQVAKERGPKAYADEHLNYQFGIKPLVSDFQALAQALVLRKKIITQLRRDSGKVVRRRYTFPVEHSSIDVQEKPDSFFVYGKSTAWQSVTSTATDTKQTTTERWFSGAFTYYLPNDEGLGKIMRWALEAEKLLGLIPDASDVWNVLPWSWATDWFLNTGSVISNLTDVASYGLVMPYGYMMEKTTTTYVREQPAVLKNGQTLKIRTKTVDTVKRRVQASPFGFGVTWDGFSALQLSILAALGITRNRQGYYGD